MDNRLIIFCITLLLLLTIDIMSVFCQLGEILCQLLDEAFLEPLVLKSVFIYHPVLGDSLVSTYSSCAV